MNYYYPSKDYYYFGFDKNGSFIPCCGNIVVIEVRNNIEDGTCEFDVEFYLAQEVKSATVTFENLKNELSRCGYSIDTHNEKYVREYLKQQIDAIGKVTSVYSHLGWYKTDNGKIAFKGYKLKHPDNKVAEYNGNLDIKPRGKLQGFKTDLEKFIIGKIPLEVAIILGLSSCVVGYIRLFTSVSNIVCNIHGRTTTGKTTAAKLAISMGGNPYCGNNKNSLAGTCSTTANALYGQLRGNYGYPVLFDELGSLSKNVDINQMLYCLAEGMDKKRLNKSGDIRLLEKWSTAIIFTSEYPMLDDDVQSGLNVRVLNFADVQWTEDAKQARIVELFSKQYAGLGIDILSESVVSDDTDICKSYNQAVEEIKAKINVDDSLKDRSAKPIAIMKLTAELASKAFGVKFSTNDIVSFVIKAIEADKPIPEWREMYEHVLQRILVERNMFENAPPNNSDDNVGSINHPCYGYIQYNSYRGKPYAPQFFVVIASVLKRWCSDYKNFRANLKEWYDKGLLYKSSPKSDRYVYKERITQTSGNVKCYRIIYNSAINDSLDNTGMPVDSPQSAEEAYKNILQLFKSGCTSIKMSDDDFYCLFDNLFGYYDVYCTYSYNPDGKNANGSEIKLSIKEKKVEEKKRPDYEIKTIAEVLHDGDSDETDSKPNDD